MDLMEMVLACLHFPEVSYVRNSVEIFVTNGISLFHHSLPSSGGESIESIDSIRKYAPQIYATQKSFECK